MARRFRRAAQIKQQGEKQRLDEQGDAGDTQPLPGVKKPVDSLGFHPTCFIASASRVERTLLMGNEGLLPGGAADRRYQRHLGRVDKPGALREPVARAQDECGNAEEGGRHQCGAQPSGLIPPSQKHEPAFEAPAGRQRRLTESRRWRLVRMDLEQHGLATCYFPTGNTSCVAICEKIPGMPSDWNEPPATWNSLSMKPAMNPCRAICMCGRRCQELVFGS